MTSPTKPTAYTEGVRVHEAREECRRIIEAAKGDKQLGNARDREHGYSKARTDTP